MLDRTISLRGNGNLREAVQGGHVQARALLKQVHADVMIWGNVIYSGGKSALSLHWTAGAAVEPKKSA